MKNNATLKFIVHTHFFIFPILILLLLNITSWTSSYNFEIYMLIFSFEIIVILSSLLSLGSKKNEYEEVLSRVIKDTPIVIQLVSWTFLAAFSLIFVFADLVPFPSAIVFLLGTFAWIGSLVSVISQNIFLNIFKSIYTDESKSFFSLLNRYLAYVMFGFVYFLISRIILAPRILRKPISLFISSFCLLTMVLCIMLFE